MFKILVGSADVLVGCAEIEFPQVCGCVFQRKQFVLSGWDEQVVLMVDSDVCLSIRMWKLMKGQALRNGVDRVRSRGKNALTLIRWEQIVADGR